MKFDPTAKALSYAAWSGAGAAFLLGRPFIGGCILGVHAGLSFIFYWMS